MGKLRTSEHLQAALDDEIGWRLSEISSYKSAIALSQGVRQTALLRASVPIAYSHWEGFVKRAANYYGVFLSSQNFTYSSLKPCFTGVGVMGLVQNIGKVKKKIATASEIVVEIQSFGRRPVSINLWTIMEDVGNLNYDLFEELARFLNISTLNYQTKKNFIDESLISTRNKIAHGERLEVDREAVESSFMEVIGLMRSFKTDIENAVITKQYLA